MLLKKDSTKNFGREIYSHVENTAERIGRGIVSGFAGTLAITASQMVEMKITKRAASDTPVKAAGKVFGFKPDCQEEENCENKSKLNNLVHFSYGTLWGEVRSLISFFGISGWKASALHFGLVWFAELVSMSSLKIAPPVKQWGFKSIVTDGIHHLIYAVAAGFLYDKMEKFRS